MLMLWFDFRSVHANVHQSYETLCVHGRYTQRHLLLVSPAEGILRRTFSELMAWASVLNTYQCACVGPNSLK